MELPVTNVVGQRTDYDRLSRFGQRRRPSGERIGVGGQNCQRTIPLFINFDEELKMVEEVVEEEAPLNENLFRTVEELELSVQRELSQNANIRTSGSCSAPRRRC